MTAERPGLVAALDALRIRDFRRFFVGGLITNSGRWLSLVTLPAVLHDITDSATWVGVGAFAQLGAIMAVGPLGGSLADRFPRQRVMVVTQILQALVAAALAIVYASGVREPMTYVGFGILTGLSSGINLPAWQAFVVELVPRSMMLNAVTLNSTQFTAARAIGPGLGGLLLAAGGPALAFTVNAISFGAVLWALLLITPPPPRPSQTTGRPRPIRELRQTVAYVRTEPGIVLAMCTVGLMAMFGQPVIRLLIVVARDALDASDGQYGLLISLYGAGSIIAAPFIAGFGPRARRSHLTLAGLAAYCGAMFVLGSASTMLVAAVALVFFGIAHLAVSTSLNTTLQLHVDDATRARVIALYLMVLTGSQPIGALVLGIVIDATDTRPAILIAGAALAIGVVLLAHRLPALDSDEGAGATASKADNQPEAVTGHTATDIASGPSQSRRT